MTPDEFQVWMAVVRSSETKWMKDEIQWHNNQVLLAYKGGENGVFVRIDPDGLATAGRYQGAIPHIGEALFIDRYRKQFQDQNQAFTHIAERLGIAFLVNITTGFPCAR